MGEIGKITEYDRSKHFGFLMTEKLSNVFFHKNDLPQEINEKILNDEDSLKDLLFEIEVIDQGQGKYKAKSIKYISDRLPQDTRNNLTEPSEIDNFYLKLNKVVRYEGKKFELFKTDRGKTIYEIKPNFSEVDFHNIKNNIVNIQSSFKSRGYEIASFTFSPEWRLIIGLGSESVYETSMTLHHIYGIPLIPGQAIKGITRNWIIAEGFQGIEGDKKDGALSNKEFCQIFGSPKDSIIGEHQGSIVFFDAMPTIPPTLEVDIMNPHYADYYCGAMPPADYLKPVPISFLTVCKDSQFQFMIGIKKNKNLEKTTIGKYSGTLLEITENLLKEAFSEHGIGAKTAVGYGYGIAQKL